MSKVALVTGASSGIGAATVRRLLERGYRVYAAARRVERMAELERLGARLISLDVTDDASMVSAIATIEQEAGRLDLLVNNAGYGAYGALEDVPLSEGRRQFDVNLFGLARLCQLSIPMMRAQKSGRIINVSSMGGRFGEPFGSWYHATKFAVEGLSDSLRMELKPFGVDVVVIQPGAIRTEWNGIARDSLVETSGATAYGPYALRYATFLADADKDGGFASKPDVVAAAIVRAATVNRPKTRYAVGGGAGVILALVKLLPDRALDWILWRASQSKPPQAPRSGKT